jgi:hypothetical protein
LSFSGRASPDSQGDRLIAMPKKKTTTKKTKSKRKISKHTATKRTKKSAAARRGAHPVKAVKKKQSRKKSSSRTDSSRRSKSVRRVVEELDSRSGGVRRASDRESDFEGLSRAEEADSESVDELVEEGNVFEAGAVAGVEAADDEDTKEVRTHELPEDDVPGEYLDKD